MLALSLALALSPVGLEPGRPADPPSIVVVLADDLGRDNVRALREHPVPARTTHLDRLAAEGVVFRRAYACPVCSPTRAALLTGRYGWRYELGTVILPAATEGGLDPSLPTLADVVGPAYRRVALGKWHLSDQTQLAGPVAPPLAMGFDAYRLTWFNLNYAQQSYTRFVKYSDAAPPEVVHRYATTDTVDDAIAEVSGATGPLFLWMAVHAPHSPFHDPPHELHSVDTSSGADEILYKAMVEALDTELGRFLDALAVSPIADNTYVFFLGDNGTPEEVTLPPWDPAHAKTTPYDGGTRVPLIVWGPGLTHVESRALVSVTDVFATVAELTGSSLTAPDSVSLVPYLHGDPGSPRAAVYAETFGPNGHGPLLFHKRVARGERFKLIDYRQTPDELYDLYADPLETNDLLQGGVHGIPPEALPEYRRLLDVLEANGGATFF